MVEQGYPGTAEYAYRSALRGILITALLPHYGNSRFVQQMMVKGMISAGKVISKPFSKKKPAREQKLPLKLVMGSQYVIGRPGGGEVLTRLAGKQGYFNLAFWPYRKRKQAVTGKVRLHGKLQDYLERGAEISSLTVSAGDAPARKLTVTITFKGKLKYFLSVTDVQKQAKTMSSKKKSKNVKSAGLDINRLSKYMLAYSGREKMSKELLKVVNRYLNLEKTTSELHAGLDRKKKAFTAYPSKEKHVAWLKVKGELDRVYNRRKELLADIHRKSSRFTAAVLLANGSHVLCVEDLNMTAKGTKGALAKAILSMPDGSSLYERSCLLVEWLTGETTTLVKVDPRGTSQCRHHGCPSVPAGKILRDINNRDVAPCSSCHSRVNVHDNSALEINERGQVLLAIPP
jgi:septum formation topological specificity factor MinE